ncbi:excinuclease ABC subunit UvrC [Casimicrobium huifangae]|uniref:excinuclease ABC subunit UvrC n=1 Tax=Casimicrobium huifangae TaxID=2591109 RepID=UPI0012EBBD41|nr:excinuclease ABC subunit UvrC [Casimicrobium huifangae]
MTDAIDDTLKSLPQRPGVYRMIGANAAGEESLLYVGKAKNLKSRVSSYFVKSGHSARIQMMIAQIRRIETTVTRSEAEALLLENNLIKTLEPKYNVVFRDDKSYPYLCISGDPFPQLRFFRGKPDKKHQYFGPFPSAWAVREGINTLQKVFQLRTCENTVFAHRSRPCMLAQIGRCTASCVGQISEADYAADVKSAAMFLRGQQDEVTHELNAQMEAAAGELAFEKAARIRDKIARLNRLVSKQFVSSVADRDVDVLALVQTGGMIAVNIVVIRGGQHVGDRTHFPVKNASSEPMTDKELTGVLESFIAQHYIGREVPGMIVSTLEFDVEALAEALSTQANSKVSVLCNPIGEKRVWLQMAEENARLAIAAKQRQSDTGNERLQALIVALDLPEGTQRLECFDISHTMGEATVASCVVFDQNAMQTGQYRRFNIQTVSDGDDYGAMKEALTRRAARIAKEEVPHPDVWVIDGGKGQVGIAAQVLAEAGLHDIVLFGSAKGVERKKGMEQIVFPDREDTVRLPADHPGLHLIQQMQDEAHRFAIQGHRAKRAKAREGSALDDIEGIGPRKRAALLKQFGSVRGIASASVEDIKRVPGISSELAERIYGVLH